MQNSIKHTQYIPALIVTGFSAMMSQIILLRELVIIFLGNELTLGIMLGIWLLGTAIGSGIVGRMSKKLSKPIQIFIIIQFLITIILPLTIMLIRFSPKIWGLQQGELIGLTPIILLPLTALLPICILTGLLYTLGCHIYNLLTKETSAAIAKVYLLEAIGSGVGSFVVSIILIRFLETFQLAIIICTANSIAAILLLYFSKSRTSVQKMMTLSLIPVIVISAIIFFPLLDRFSLKKFWRNAELLSSETTIYGNIATTRLGDNISFYENGFLMFTYPDLFSAEEAVHFVLLQHPKPQKVLLIGGGVGGSLQQILFHPNITHVDYVELDPKIIELSEHYLPAEENSILKDPRIQIWHTDGRLFVKQTDQKYDAVIVNLPDPQTTLINRFYTLEFYQQVKKILTTDGVVGFSVTSSENVIGSDLANFLSCLYNTISQVFTEVVLIPGNTNHFIGCVKTNVMTNDPKLVVERLQQRNLDTIYLREYYIPFRMSQDRMEYLYGRIENHKSHDVNRDFKPIGNFYNVVVWTTYFNQQVKQLFLVLNRIGFSGIWGLAIILMMPFLIMLLTKQGRQQSFRYGIIASIATIGFTELSLEVVIILGFQALYGYVYFQLSLILSSFMIGLAIGSYLAIRMLEHAKRVFRQFKTIQFLMALYPLILVIILNNIGHISTASIILQFIFSLLTAAAGFIAGYQYPLASHLYCKVNPNVEKTAGTLYGFDLLGACIGAFITSALLVPILGIVETCGALFILNFTIFVGLLFTKENF